MTRVARLALGVAAFALLAPLALYVVPQAGGGDVAYAVLSGSMLPTFAPGDYIVSSKFRRGDPLDVGDVVTFRVGKVLVTHRVLEVRGEPGARLVVTQGDANAHPDPQPVPEDRIVAVYLFAVPWYGHVPMFAGQPLGRLLLVAGPAAAVMVLEARKLARLLAARAQAAAPPAGPPAALAGAVTLLPAAPVAQAAGAAPRRAPPGPRHAPARFVVVRRPPR